ncbi:MAG: YhbY family RNA-binding protein [Clostridia bacterium]|nr:YhbY family RNA-binding protein [Clostridia bacterium]
MITTKQRASLKSLSMTMPDLAQVGKEGLSNSCIDSIRQVLEARELIKIKVQKNCDLTPREVAQELEEMFNCEIVLVVGSKVVIYKRSDRKDIKHIEF